MKGSFYLIEKTIFTKRKAFFLEEKGIFSNGKVLFFLKQKAIILK